MVWMMILAWLSVAPPDKQEAETRITRDGFPASALRWLEPVTQRARNVRYFRQSDGTDLTLGQVPDRLGDMECGVSRRRHL